MSRFYYPNVVGKGQQVKMQRRGPVLTPTVVSTSNMSKLGLCISGAREFVLCEAQTWQGGFCSVVVITSA